MKIFFSAVNALRTYETISYVSYKGSESEKGHKGRKVYEWIFESHSESTDYPMNL
jgi:hypothetical protein